MSSFEGTYVIKKASDAAEALDKNIINETIWDEISFEMSEPLTHHVLESITKVPCFSIQGGFPSDF